MPGKPTQEIHAQRQQQLVDFIQSNPVIQSELDRLLTDNISANRQASSGAESIIPNESDAVDAQFFDILHNEDELRIIPIDNDYYYSFVRRFGGKNNTKEARLDVFYCTADNDRYARGGYGAIYRGLGTLVKKNPVAQSSIDSIPCVNGSILYLKRETRQGNHRIMKKFKLPVASKEEAIKEAQAHIHLKYTHAKQIHQKGFEHNTAPEEMVWCDVDGLYNITMRRFGEQSLRELFDSGVKLATDDRYSLAIALLNAYQEQIILGFVHLDIKPDNIMVDRGDNNQWIVNYIDIGSVARTEDETMIQAGTAGYIAPELFENSSAKYHKAQDIYSLGNVINEVFGLPANGHFQRFEQRNLGVTNKQAYRRGVEVAREYVRNNRPTYGYQVFDDIFDADGLDKTAVLQLTARMTSTDIEVRGNIGEAIEALTSAQTQWRDKQHSHQPEKQQAAISALSDKLRVLSELLSATVVSHQTTYAEEVTACLGQLTSLTDVPSADVAKTMAQARAELIRLQDAFLMYISDYCGSGKPLLQQRLAELAKAEMRNTGCITVLLANCLRVASELANYDAKTPNCSTVIDYIQESIHEALSTYEAQGSMNNNPIFAAIEAYDSVEGTIDEKILAFVKVRYEQEQQALTATTISNASEEQQAEFTRTKRDVIAYSATKVTSDPSDLKKPTAIEQAVGYQCEAGYLKDTRELFTVAKSSEDENSHFTARFNAYQDKYNDREPTISALNLATKAFVGGLIVALGIAIIASGPIGWAALGGTIAGIEITVGAMVGIAAVTGAITGAGAGAALARVHRYQFWQQPHTDDLLAVGTHKSPEPRP